MNPWKIIGWIVLVFLVLLIYSCGKAINERSSSAGSYTDSPASLSATAPAPAQPLTADLLSFSCEESATGRYTRVGITIRNTSGREISFPEAFVSVGGKIETAPFTPFEVPAGSMAEASTMSRVKGDCMLQGVQDRGGTPVSLTKKY